MFRIFKHKCESLLIEKNVFLWWLFGLVIVLGYAYLFYKGLYDADWDDFDD